MLTALEGQNGQGIDVLDGYMYTSYIQIEMLPIHTVDIYIPPLTSASTILKHVV